MSLHRTFTAAVVLGAAVIVGIPRLQAGPSANPRRTAIVEVVERNKAAVVNIHSERAARLGFGEESLALLPSQSRVNGMGTGIIIDPRGYIVTNQHVVDEVQLLRIRLSDGSSHGARVIARDQETDLALLRIDAGRPLTTLPLGTATDLMVGETVIAIGNAYGYEHTVTTGIVSAVKRDVTLNKDVSYKSLIQTDASINPGNSGGPLLNINGELVGVNVAIRAGAQGIGFAIPVDTMMRVVADMMSIRKRSGISHGLVCRDRLEPVAASRIQTSSADLEPAPESNGTETVGWKREVVVEKTEATGPAAKAGLERGDVLLKVGDTPVTCGLEMERALLDHTAGDKIPVVVRRKGAEHRFELVLQALDRTPAAADVIWKKIGVRILPVSADVVSRSNPQLHGGVSILEVSPDGPAGKAGIQRGDILVGLHQWETLNVDNVLYVVTHADLSTFLPLRFFIVRAGTVHRGWIQQLD
jgi:serine protease Do